MNASNNHFTGTIPLQLGQTGIFQLPAVNVGNNELMSHVFDLSNNDLTGTVPNYLDFDVLRNYVSSGIYLRVCPIIHLHVFRQSASLCPFPKRKAPCCSIGMESC